MFYRISHPQKETFVFKAEVSWHEAFFDLHKNSLNSLFFKDLSYSLSWMETCDLKSFRFVIVKLGVHFTYIFGHEVGSQQDPNTLACRQSILQQYKQGLKLELYSTGKVFGLCLFYEILKC